MPLDPEFALLYQSYGTPWWRNYIYLVEHPGTTYWETFFGRIWITALIFWQVLTSSLRKRPNLLLFGVEKCGTSTLAAHLCSNSKISCPQVAYVKEETHYSVRWDKLPFSFLGFDLGYKAHGPLIFSNFSYVLDADMQNAFFPGPSASLSPVGTKFILMLRDPVERAMSAWNMFLRNPNKISIHKKMSFDAACEFYLSSDPYALQKIAATRLSERVSDDDISYFELMSLHGIFELGKYDVPLAMILRKHPPDNIFVSHIRILKHEPQALYNACCQFLQIPAQVLPDLRLKRFSAEACTLGEKAGLSCSSDKVILQLRNHFRAACQRTNTLLARVQTYPVNLVIDVDAGAVKCQ